MLGTEHHYGGYLPSDWVGYSSQFCTQTLTTLFHRGGTADHVGGAALRGCFDQQPNQGSIDGVLPQSHGRSAKKRARGGRGHCTLQTQYGQMHSGEGPSLKKALGTAGRDPLLAMPTPVC